MEIIDMLKTVLNLAQKSDNFELYRQLLDLNTKVLELQSEVTRLNEENAELKRIKELSDRVIRHREPYITLAGEKENLYYCSHCWDTSKLLVQLQCNDYLATFECPHCHMQGSYDSEKNRCVALEQEDAINRICDEANRSFNSNNLW